MRLFQAALDTPLDSPFSATLSVLETNLASRWWGVRLPRASGKSPDFPGSSLNFPGSFRRLPRKFSHCGTNSNPEVPRKFPKLPRKFPKPPRKFRDFPGGQPLSLGSLTPSPDSQKLSLTVHGLHFTVCAPSNKLLFSNFSGNSGISRQNPATSRPKGWFPWVSRDIPSFMAPTRSRRNEPHPTRRYPDQRVWVWVPFSRLRIT